MFRNFLMDTQGLSQWDYLGCSTSSDHWASSNVSIVRSTLFWGHFCNEFFFFRLTFCFKEKIDIFIAIPVVATRENWHPDRDRAAVPYAGFPIHPPPSWGLRSSARSFLNKLHLVYCWPQPSNMYSIWKWSWIGAFISWGKHLLLHNHCNKDWASKSKHERAEEVWNI